MTSRPGVAARQDNHLLGIAVMIAAIFFLSSMDATAKWLSADYALPQIVFFRSLIAVMIILPFTVRESGWSGFRTKRPGVHVMRGMFMAAASFMFFYAISIMKLADATAIVLTAPLMITALSAPLLGEAVGARRWAAVALGFVGMLIIVRPGFSVFEPAGLIVLLVAFCYSMIMITNRSLRHSESLTALTLYAQTGPLLVSAILLWPTWRPIPAGDLWVFGLIGILAGFAHLFLTLAFRYAPAALVSPFDYMSLIWATLFGYMFWTELPDAAAVSGMLLIAGAGLYIIWREHRLHRPPPDDFPQEPH